MKVMRPTLKIGDFDSFYITLITEEGEMTTIWPFSRFMDNEDPMTKLFRDGGVGRIMDLPSASIEVGFCNKKLTKREMMKKRA
jgi:hypothetical protein